MKAISSRTPETVFKAIVEAACEVRGRAALSHYPSKRLWVARLHETAEEQSGAFGAVTTGGCADLDGYQGKRGNRAVKYTRAIHFVVPNLAQASRLIAEKRAFGQ
jgi:hypothetical protein